MQHAVKKRLLRRSRLFYRLLQKRNGRVKKPSVGAGFLPLAPVEQPQRQRQQRQPFIESAAQYLIESRTVCHLPASLRFSQYSTKDFHTKGKSSVSRKNRQAFGLPVESQDKIPVDCKNSTNIMTGAI